jgi:hypothetical protein
VCYSRRFARFVEIQRGEKDGEEFGEEFDDNASRHIFPVHWLNSLALVVTYGGFLLWLFRSPHMASVEAAHLDRTCGSFFTLNLLANFFITGTSLNNCTDGTVFKIMLSTYVLAGSGMSICGCNILCHRYLIEKAKTIMKL